MKNEPDLKRIFQIDIAEGETGLIGVVKSITENKAMIIKAPNLRLMMTAISRKVRNRRSYLRRFPFIPSPIVTIEENMAHTPSRIIVPGSNGG